MRGGVLIYTVSILQAMHAQQIQPVYEYSQSQEPEISHHLTCGELKDLGTNFYRQIPAFVAKLVPNDSLTLEQTMLSGNCFSNISLQAVFSYLDEGKT
jgi:hypothetical protein